MGEREECVWVEIALSQYIVKGSGNGPIDMQCLCLDWIISVSSNGPLTLRHTSFMMEIGLEASQRPMPNYNAQENKWPFKAHDLATICWAMSANG